jgi:hypothetical protein
MGFIARLSDWGGYSTLCVDFNMTHTAKIASQMCDFHVDAAPNNRLGYGV